MLVPVRVNALSVVAREANLAELYNTLLESLKRQLIAAESCVVSELRSTKRISPPQPFHFNPLPLGHFLTLYYPRDVPDTELGKFLPRTSML